MGWWKKLKAWQKGGLLLGFLHFIVSMVLILTRGDGGGLIFVEIWIESPWLFVLYLLGIKNPANFLVYPIIPIFIGSITYGIIGGLIWHYIGKVQSKGKVNE